MVYSTESYESYLDEALFMVADPTNTPTTCYFAHDHLYSPVALMEPNAAVRERYEYDAYGNCHVLEPNFADDPDGKPDEVYGNSGMVQFRVAASSAAWGWQTPKNGPAIPKSFGFEAATPYGATSQCYPASDSFEPCPKMAPDLLSAG